MKLIVKEVRGRYRYYCPDDITLSKLVQDVINGNECKNWAQNKLRNLSFDYPNNKHLEKCFQEVKKMPYEYSGKWVRATDGFDYTINSLDNQNRNYRNSIDHF